MHLEKKNLKKSGTDILTTDRLKQKGPRRISVVVNRAVGQKDIGILIHYGSNNTAVNNIKHQLAEFQEEMDKSSGVARNFYTPLKSS